MSLSLFSFNIFNSSAEKLEIGALMRTISIYNLLLRKALYIHSSVLRWSINHLPIFFFLEDENEVKSLFGF